jgi:hypothetical protein
MLLGRVEIDCEGTAAEESRDWLAEHRVRIAALGMTPAEFSRDSCEVIRITHLNLGSARVRGRGRVISGNAIRERLRADSWAPPGV